MDISNIKTPAVAPNVPALTPIKLSDYQAGQIRVCAFAVADIVVEVAPKSEEDPCVPSEAWEPEKCVDLCGNGEETEQVIVIDEVPAGGKCCFNIKPCGDYVRFSVDVEVYGICKDRRPPVNYGCGPTTAA